MDELLSISMLEVFFEIVGFINRKEGIVAFEGLGNKHPFIGLSTTIWVAGKHYMYNLYIVKKILIWSQTF